MSNTQDLISDKEDILEQLKQYDKAITSMNIDKEESKLAKINEREILKQLHNHDIFYRCSQNTLDDEMEDMSEEEMLRKINEFRRDDFCLEAEIEVLRESVAEQGKSGSKLFLLLWV